MAMSQKMGLKMGLGMQLRMTPQLQQAIKLLQLSRLELEQEVRKELEDNPVLEEFADGPDDMTNPGVQADANENTENNREQQDPQKQDEINWDEYFDATYKPMPNMSGGNEEIMTADRGAGFFQHAADVGVMPVGIAVQRQHSQVRQQFLHLRGKDGRFPAPGAEAQLAGHHDAGAQGVGIQRGQALDQRAARVPDQGG